MSRKSKLRKQISETQQAYEDESSPSLKGALHLQLHKLRMELLKLSSKKGRSDD